MLILLILLGVGVIALSVAVLFSRQADRTEEGATDRLGRGREGRLREALWKALDDRIRRKTTARSRRG
jgi:hypothetical protein